MTIEKAQEARANAHLDRVLRHNGVLKTARAMVTELVNQGRTAKVKTYEWKDKERTAYVLEDEAEGIFVELSKTQYLYALELIAQREAEPQPIQEAEPRPIQEEVKPGHDIGEGMTAWPVIVATLREALALLRGGMSVPQVKNFVSVKLNPDNQEGPLTTWDINMLKTLAYVSPDNFKTRLQYTRRLSVELKDAEEQLAKMQARNPEESRENNMKALKPFTVVLSESDDASSISVRQVTAADEEAAVLAAKKEWYADQTCGWDDEYLEDYPFHPGNWDDIAVVAAATASPDTGAAPAPVIEEYRTAVLSTAHMMESDYQILTDNAAQVGSDDGIFWIHDTQAGAILRFEASCHTAAEDLASLGASRLLIDTISRLEKLGYQAAHFDRDADRVTDWPVDPQYADENE